MTTKRILTGAAAVIVLGLTVCLVAVVLHQAMNYETGSDKYTRYGKDSSYIR